MNNQIATKPTHPIRENIKRLPGTSLRKRMDNLFDNELIPYWAVFCLSTMLTVFEWMFLYMETPRTPWFVTCLAVISGTLFWYKFKTITPLLTRASIGEDGEIYVAQVLSQFQAVGFSLIHDVQCQSKKGARFNIDHILVGPKGVFVVETKTRSKYGRENESIEFGENGLIIGGYTSGYKEINQVCRDQEFIHNLLNERTGKGFEVDGVLLFPGWYVAPHATSVVRNQFRIYMLNPKTLKGYINKFTNTLSQEEVEQIEKILVSYSAQIADLDNSQ